MIFNEQLGDEDLAFYALRLLDDAEQAVIAGNLAQDPQLRQRLADVQALLAAYIQTIDLKPVPNGSLERLMDRIAQDRVAQDHTAQDRPRLVPSSRVLQLPAAPTPPRLVDTLLLWTGWALAATLALAAGQLYHRRQSPPAIIAVQQPPPPQAPNLPVDLLAQRDALAEQRDALAADVADQSRQIQQLTAEAARAKKEAETLHLAAAGQSSKVSTQTQQLANQLAQTQAERDSLRGTLAAQADQVTRLNSEASQAHLVTETLTDPLAVRVTLTKPKSRPAPTGRATYAANRATLVFLASNLAPLQSDKTYQLWLMPADGSKPVPAGTFTPDARGNASVVYTRFAQSIPAKGFAVTIESTGGATTPTLPIILAGNA